MSHHIAHAVPDYITHELAVLRLWCGIYRQPAEEFVRRYGAQFEERHGQPPRTRCGDRIARTEQAVERVQTVVAAHADWRAPLEDLERATQDFEDAVHDASTTGACQERPLLPGRGEEWIDRRVPFSLKDPDVGRPS